MNFNPRTREGCDFLILKQVNSRLNFNPRTREGCDLRPSRRGSRTSAFQSTHPRGVRQIIGKLRITIRIISIHAPARGATSSCPWLDECVYISIHAPARGATGLRQKPLSLESSFQSTHPRGVRRRRDGAGDAWRKISIHAPARGATGHVGRFQIVRAISIHAPARGATALCFYHPNLCSHFNPRTREGCDRGFPC